MMVELEDLLPEVLPLAPTAPEPSILKHLRDCARDFCERTKAWRDNDSFTVAAPEWEGLCTTPDADIVSIEDCKLDGCELDPITVFDLDALRKGWRTDTDEATAKYVTQLQPNSVTIYPRQTGLLELGLVLKPSRTAITIPDWMVSQFGTEIGRGAAGRVLITPNVEYANPSLGGTLLNEFKGFLDTQSLKVRKGQQNARKRTKPVFF